MRNIIMAAVAAALLGSTATAAYAAQTPIVIKLSNLGGVEPGTQAYEGFKTAAKFWEDHLTTSQPTSLKFNVGFSPLGPGILGETGSTFTAKLAVNVENRIIARQFGAFDAQAAANLPTLGNGIFGAGTAMTMTTPGYTDPIARTGIDNSTSVLDNDGGFNNSVIGLTTANAKALGYAFNPGQADASITFSSDFGFDFNSSDGIADDSYDFLAVAIHEMGHALGFVSGVDDYDVLGTGGPLADFQCFSDGTLCKNYPANDDWFGETLDLFRYSDANKLDWTTGTSSYFSVDRGASAYQSGLFSTGAFNGDGNQASHWIDNTYAPRINPHCSNVITPGIGIMNPTVGACEQGVVTGLDLAAFDAIGWNTTEDVGHNPGLAISTRDIGAWVPEPSTWALMIGGFGLAGVSLRRRGGARLA